MKVIQEMFPDVAGEAVTQLRNEHGLNAISQQEKSKPLCSADTACIAAHGQE